MSAIWSFIVGIWNFAVSVAPTVLHTACQLTEQAGDAIKLGGGS